MFKFIRETSTNLLIPEWYDEDQDQLTYEEPVKLTQKLDTISFSLVILFSYLNHEIIVIVEYEFSNCFMHLQGM